MRGMIIIGALDGCGEFEKEVSGYLKSGKLQCKMTVVDGFDQAVCVFIGLFHGKYAGKMVVKLA